MAHYSWMDDSVDDLLLLIILWWLMTGDILVLLKPSSICPRAALSWSLMTCHSWMPCSWTVVTHGEVMVDWWSRHLGCTKFVSMIEWPMTDIDSTLGPCGSPVPCRSIVPSVVSSTARSRSKGAAQTLHHSDAQMTSRWSCYTIQQHNLSSCPSVLCIFFARESKYGRWKLVPGIDFPLKACPSFVRE